MKEGIKMKIMIIISLLFCMTNIFAQLDGSKIKIDVAPELAIPIGDLADFSGVGLGFSSRAYYQLESTIDFTLTTGFTYFTEGEYDNSSAYLIPIKGGLRYFIIKNNKRLYSIIELGIDIINWEIDDKKKNHTVSHNKTSLCLAPGIGYKFNMENSILDLSGRFEFADNGSSFAIRAGYYLPVRF